MGVASAANSRSSCSCKVRSDNLCSLRGEVGDSGDGGDGGGASLGPTGARKVSCNGRCPALIMPRTTVYSLPATSSPDTLSNTCDLFARMWSEHAPAQRLRTQHAAQHMTVAREPIRWWGVVAVPIVLHHWALAGRS
jgi:hypothetical protein